jgi:hypothetical protein
LVLRNVNSAAKNDSAIKWEKIRRGTAITEFV